MRDGRRGSALVVVLLLAALLLVVGFAVADLCFSSLHFAHVYSEAARSRLLARAAAAHFLGEMEVLSAAARGKGLNLEDLSPADLGLRHRYADGNGLPDALAGNATVRVTFDPRARWCSVDNSASEYPAAGWLDRGQPTKSVPPFSVDLQIGVTLAGSERHYEAVVTRRWPYAAFTTSGCIGLTGSVAGAGATGPSVVDGAVATLHPTEPGEMWDVAAATSRSSTATLAGRLALAAAWERDRTLLDATGTVSVGEPMRLLPAAPVSPPAPYARCHIYEVFAPDRAAPVSFLDANPGNELGGDAWLPAGTGVAPDVAVGPGSRFDGQVRHGGFPPNLDDAHNPLLDVRLPVPGDGYRLAALPSTTTVREAGFNLLDGSMRLAGDALGNRLWVPNDLGNRWIAPCPPLTTHMTVTESGGRMVLRNCILYVNGNLDLSSASVGGADLSTVGIDGTNATLVVKGSLVLSGGRLDSRDQGMVIYARDVIMRALGNYRGLIIAQRSLSMLGADGGGGEGLSIRGALLCGGNLILRSVHLTYDPTYLKSLHDYGPAVVVGWREVR